MPEQQAANRKLYISDWHYGHNNILAFDNRPFKTVEEMNAALVERWNAAVHPGDTVYVLGDMFWCNMQEAISVLNQLNGQVFLIKGNHEDCIWVSTLKQRFYMALTDALKKNGCAEIVHTNGASVLSPGKTLNLCLHGIDGQTLLLMLDGKSICISAGSACRSHEAEPSHVLIAMGLTPDEARSSIRISFSRMNTADEIVDAANIIASCIEILASGVEK